MYVCIGNDDRLSTLVLLGGFGTFRILFTLRDSLWLFSFYHLASPSWAPPTSSSMPPCVKSLKATSSVAKPAYPVLILLQQIATSPVSSVERGEWSSFYVILQIIMQVGVDRATFFLRAPSNTASAGQWSVYLLVLVIMLMDSLVMSFL